MRSGSEAWIFDGVRTPRGKGRPDGALHPVHPQELLAQCLNALVARNGIDPADVADVVAGNLSGVDDHGHCIARLAVLAAGWPVEVPGLTINRFCGSGQQAVNIAAMGIRAGMQDVVVAGGVESMSRWSPPSGPPITDGQNPALRTRYPFVPQGISADLIATLEGFSRADCDAYGAESQRRAAVAVDEGRFKRSLVPVLDAEGATILASDEHPRPGTTVEALAALKPAFEAMGQFAVEDGRTFDEICVELYPQVESVDHVHHGGNSSGVVDGAAALLLGSDRFAAQSGLAPRARVVATAAAGAEPVIMLTAPTPAAQAALDRAGMTCADIDLWEINEAFAAVVLKTTRDLDLDPETVNVNGGAVALGHPIGATGAMLIQTALDELERRDATTALVVMCTGAGMGTATIIERAG